MAPCLQWQPQHYAGDEISITEVMSLDLNLPVMQIDRNVPIFDDETRNHKRLKLEYPINGSIGSLPRLQFRDHVWAYTQRYLAIKLRKKA